MRGVVLFLLASTGVQAVRAESVRWGVDLRAYPAGLIPAVRVDVPLSEPDIVLLCAGMNFTDRHDWGEHDNEQGNGFGFGGGWIHRLGMREKAWIVGLRADLWFLSIDWEDPQRSGTTEVTVFQPTATGGYRWQTGGGAWRWELSVGLGAEFNVSTRGEDVGHGVIGLLGLGVSR